MLKKILTPVSDLLQMMLLYGEIKLKKYRS